jgi:DNA-dependent RNA polymerase
MVYLEPYLVLRYVFILLFMENQNVLFKEGYLISNDLWLALRGNPFFNWSRRTDNNLRGVYVVTIRMVSEKESNKLVYNYILYDSLFFECLLAYFLFKRKDSLAFREHGYYFTIFDVYSFRDNLSAEDGRKTLVKYYNEKLFIYLNKNKKLPFLYSHVLDFIYKINIFGDCDKMSYLIDLACRRLYLDFINNVLHDFDSYNLFDGKLNTICKYDTKDHNILKGCIFVVRDIHSLINSLVDKGYSINQGIQKYRGQINSANSLLNCIDIDFRDSLYNHNKYHIDMGTRPKDSYLTRDKFSFKRIHMGLGNVRWYSTKRNTKYVTSDMLKSRAIKSIEKESFIFQQLSNYIKNSPVNEDTQINIEKFLLDYSYISFRDEKEKDSLINYKLISNEFTKLLKNNESIIINLINRIKNKTYNKEPIRQKENVQYQLSIILKELDDDLVISILYGRLLRIVSNYNKLNTSNNFTNISTDIGRDIINNYYYSLYIKSMLPYIDILLKDTDNLFKEKLINDSNIKFIFDKAKQYRNKLDKSNLLYYCKSLYKNMISLVKLDDYIKLNYSFSNWKQDNNNIVSKYDSILENLIGARFIDWMIDIGFIKIDLKVWNKKEKENTIVPTDFVLNTLKNTESLFHLPHRVPMIVKPKPYYREVVEGKSIDRLGGYLLNDEKITYNLIIENWELKESSVIKDSNIVFDLVNNMSSVGFKINKDVLNFINEYGIEYNLILGKDYKDPLLSKNKLSKVDRVKLESFFSRKLLQENILGLANVYSNVSEFFLPVRLDYRGRMNCISEYLNYQSNELAKSLLLFSKTEKIFKSDIKSINYLKAFGANCFGNKLDKKSWLDRIKWVDDNVNGIINFRDGVLISKAENKLLFIAFCFEYNRLLNILSNNDISYFESHLPIQLDATCNGYQHLSLLCLDYKLAKELNLTKSTWNDLPKDFYSFISTKLTDLVRNKLKSNNLCKDKKESYERLSKITLVRKIVKKAIMNIPYNVSIPRMIEYIQDNFELCNSNINKDIKNNLDFWYQLIDDENIKIKQRDFTVIAMELIEILHNDVFKLSKLLKYLKDIAKICTDLSITIPWGLPSGIEVKQSYLTSKEVRLKPFTFSKNSFLLKIPNKNKYNVQRQKRAFMPNLIHSLDATSLAMLVDLYFNSINGIKNLYAVHDCFAVTANNVENLMEFLKLVYINLYSDNHYLKQLDKQIINHIKFHYGEDSFNEKTLIIDTKDIHKMKYPNIKTVLDEDIDAKFVLETSYIIS